MSFLSSIFLYFPIDFYLQTLLFFVQLADRTSIIAKGVFIIFIAIGFEPLA